MSPTEFDLRSALRDGEGDEPNVNRIVAGAAAQRAQRRSRLLSTAAVVVLVAGAGAGGTLLARSAGDGSDVAGSTAGGQASAAAGGGQAAGATPQPRAPSQTGGPADRCPAEPARTFLPGGGSPGQFGSGGPLFPEPVASALLCTYSDMTPSSAPSAVELGATAATTLTDSLERAARTKPDAPCSTLRLATQRTLVIIARTATGAAEREVTTTLDEPACAVVVTNGTAVRYGWTPPGSLDPTLDPSGLPRVEPSNRIQGSPVRS